LWACRAHAPRKYAHAICPARPLGLRAVSRHGYPAREAVARTACAVLGGYAFAWCFTACLSRALPAVFGMAVSEAVITASMLSFVVYLVVIVRVFALRSAWHAAGETWGIAALLALASWALPAPAAPAAPTPPAHAHGVSR
jgi:hypothetical protein